MKKNRCDNDEISIHPTLCLELDQPMRLSDADQTSRPVLAGFLFCLLWTLINLHPVFAENGISFRDITKTGAGPGVEASGLTYSRAPSYSEAVWAPFLQQGFLLFSDIAFTPTKSRGAPGVAILDFDGDHDLDIYVTNGPLSENRLFSNQLEETGLLQFIDLAAAAGVNAPDHDSSGVCYGDIDNDGDADLFVLSNFGPNRLFENNGDGRFTDISSMSGLGADTKSSLSCSFGDINGDGLLDVAVANCCQDMSNQLPFTVPEPFAFNQHNQLFLNAGGNTFVDVSSSSGFTTHQGFPSGFEGYPSVTWAIAMVDYDLDGDVDIFTADDQGAVPPASVGGVDRGIIHLFQNDGTGHFQDVTVDSNLNHTGGWMGFAFGDVDADGWLDFFATNFGDWGLTTLSPLDPVYGDFLPYQLGDMTSRWFLGSSAGVFTDPGVGGLIGTPFGWGTSMADYDNDGDTDIVYHGGLSSGPVVQTAPGVILQNDGAGHFTRDIDALADSTDHERRTVHGVAMGDLDRDGFADIVSVSNLDLPASVPLVPYNHQWGSPFDGGSYCQYFLPPTGSPAMVYSGIEFDQGTISVEISSGDNGNNWAKVRLLGTVGILTTGVVNRDGVGAVVNFRTSDGKTAMQPVLGGSSYASQDSLELIFGLGSSRRGRLDVWWPGGNRNRLYNVKRGEEILFPEIPCSFEGDWRSFQEYSTCVRDSLDELVQTGVLTRRQKARFMTSAFLAFFAP